jgi:hypothetical protein
MAVCCVLWSGELQGFVIHEMMPDVIGLVLELIKRKAMSDTEPNESNSQQLGPPCSR